jgi:hypothetical protein
MQNTKRISRMLVALIFALGLLLAVTGIAVAADPPVAGEVVINEFVANAGTEWVELYNTTGSAKDISGFYIDDVASGGGSPVQIPASTVIAANGFYTIGFSGLLNNAGDDVRFLNASQTEFDKKTYGSSAANHSWFRYPDGQHWSGLERSSPTPGATNPGSGDAPWTPGAFEIRIFDVEQGDSQLIIFPSGYSILIDVKEASWQSGDGAGLIALKIRTILEQDWVDVGVLSHLHLDHIGYAGYGGFWGLIETEGITFSQIIDRDAGVWQDGFGGGSTDGVCEPNTEIVWRNAGTESGTARNWICYATNSANSNIYPIREIADLFSTSQIDPPDSGALVEIVQVDADGVMMADGVTPLQGNHVTDTLPPSENDYSIGLRIRYGLLDYATAGDSDGEYATSEFDYTYNNVEAILKGRYGKVDVMRANHHGSGHSSSQAYVDFLNPDASAISCGDNSFGHPAQDVIDRLLATGDLYITNTCDETRDYDGVVIVDGDIILRSYNGVTYTIDGDTTYTATDAIQSLTINEFLPAPSSGNEWVEIHNPTPYTITIGGAYIDDISGGSSPSQITAGTQIAPGGFFVMEFSSVFNNSGDDVRLLMSDGTTVIDGYTYSSAQNDKSYYRATDSGSWAASQTSNTTKGYTNVPPAGIEDILINEFVPNASQEWVELYNPTGVTIDISGAYIDDIAGGSSPQQIPASTTIAAGGYYCHNMTSAILNNTGGDTARLLKSDGSTVVDSRAYTGSPTANYSYYRSPDGGSWAGSMSSSPTKCSANP